VEVTRHAVPLAGLLPDLSGLRLVQVSDLHLGPFFGPASGRRIVALIQACQPDLVVLTGDFAHRRWGRSLREVAVEFQALPARFGVWACLGNHDYWEGVREIRATLEGVGVPVLVNEKVCLAEGLWLAAVDDLMAGQPDLDRTTDGLPEEAGVVLLSHNPTLLPQVADRPWLVLSGHTHGGQMAIPCLGPRGTARLPGIRSFMYAYEWLGVRVHHGRLETISTYRYPAGWYQAGRARMYVNRGVGLSLNWPLRLFCPPEIACFTLLSLTPQPLSH